MHEGSRSRERQRAQGLARVNFEEYLRLALSHAEYRQNSNGTWTAEVPVLPGCITWAESRAQAVEMARDAIEAWVMTALRFGDEVPVVDNSALQYATDRGAEVRA